MTEVPTQGVTPLPVKQVGLAIPNPIMSASENWTASCVFTGHLVKDLRDRTEFKTWDHTLILWKGHREIRRRNV